jgi:hypothetical protein
VRWEPYQPRGDEDKPRSRQPDGPIALVGKVAITMQRHFADELGRPADRLLVIVKWAHVYETGSAYVLEWSLLVHKDSG